MGIDYDSKLIFGWEIEQEELKTLLDNKDDEIGEYFDEIQAKLPKGAFLIYSNPYYDCGCESQRYYISLIKDHGHTLSQLIEVMKDIEAVAQIRKLAVNLGANDNEPMIFSVTHIW
jgi:hypothetical protein